MIRNTMRSTKWLKSLGFCVMTSFLAGGCDRDSPESNDGLESSDTGSTQEDDFEARFACVESELQVEPLFGPGWDSETNTLIGEPQDTYVVHTTQALVPLEGLQPFVAMSQDVVAQLMVTPGLIAIGFASEPNCGFERTTGIWASEQAMYAFVGSGAHAEAMAQTANLQVAGRATHFEVAAGDLPLPWDTIISQISSIEPFGTTSP